MNNNPKKLADALYELSRAAMAQKSNSPLNASETGTLIFISGHRAGAKTVQPGDISQYHGMAKASVTAIVTALEQGGYISRYPSERDGRAYYLEITEKGKSLITQVSDSYYAAYARLAAELGQSKCELLLESITRAVELLKENKK